jgi:putative hydrolase of the HAD superfamily
MNRVDPPYKAVIFDMFGTLVQNLGSDFTDLLERTGVLAELAGQHAETFSRLWLSPEFHRFRTLGVHRTPEVMFAEICKVLGRSPSDAALQRAGQVRRGYYRQALTPREGVIATLTELKRRGLRLGLVTVCSAELPDHLPHTPFAGLFDTMVLSCHVGWLKPDPRLYETACTGLEVAPRECLYVGDGDGHELTGAQRMGMRAVLMCDPREEQIVLARDEARHWRGARISSIPQVLGLLQARASGRAAGDGPDRGQDDGA